MIEKSIHREIHQVLQRIWDDHKICVREIEAEWRDVSTMGKVEMRLASVDLYTTTVEESKL